MKNNFEKIPKEFINEFQETSFYKQGLDGFALFKTNSESIEACEIENINFPEQLYVDINTIANLDLITTIKEFNISNEYTEYNRRLKKAIRKKNVEKTKKVLLDIMDYTLDNPNQSKLRHLSKSIDLLIDGYIGTPEILKNMSKVLNKDYGTTVHLVNTCSLMLTYSIHNKEKEEMMMSKGLAALYHDIGKTKISEDILKAPRKLTEEEFEVVKTHPKIGYDLLVNCYIRDTNILEATLQHHQRCDGSGYPYSGKKISEIAKEIAVIDTYEALTASRPYKMNFDKDYSMNIMSQYAKLQRLDTKILNKFNQVLV